MPRTKPFEEYTSRYETWFEQHYFVYQSELLAIRQILPAGGRGIEIGIGSGRFAAPFGIRYGIEPSQKMLKLAVQKEIYAIQGVAEFLPIGDEKFDFALMVTTICFLDNVEKSLQEVYRILKPGGFIVIGLVDKESPVGRLYQKNQLQSVFYREATFYSVDEVIEYLKYAGFHGFEFSQTIFKNLDQVTAINPVENGYGKGSFVVIKAKKES